MSQGLGNVYRADLFQSMSRLKLVFSFGVFVLAGLLPVQAEQVVFGEIMYHPKGDLPEYIEIYNNTATPFDIAQWKLRGGVDYDFPDFGI